MIESEKGKNRCLNFIKDFFKEVKKVVWPTPAMTFTNTGITLCMIVLVGIFVFIIDLILVNLLSLVMSISK
ncbi:MAG: preprotein translocase subunit SecE [Firmicutes bacterium]|nr:preprotein translocase subunit SecE [Bacillota bacterium]